MAGLAGLPLMVIKNQQVEIVAPKVPQGVSGLVISALGGVVFGKSLIDSTYLFLRLWVCLQFVEGWALFHITPWAFLFL